MSLESLEAPSSRQADSAANGIPLVVDVDGTLLRTDILHESTMQFVATSPWDVWRLGVWLTGGKGRLKGELADRIALDIDTLPLRTEVVETIRAAQAEGRPVYLASASDERYVQALADRVGGLAGVFGTSKTSNVAGHVKAGRLIEAFGEGGFDYIGDRPVDLDVWAKARRALMVSHSNGFEKRVRRQFPDAELIARDRQATRSYMKAMRPHQWAKNVLLFLPLAAGHDFSLQSILLALLGFACFCTAASSAYILNDVLDLPGDREHPRKRKRPFAAGDLPISHGIILSGVLMAAAWVGGAMVGLPFLSVLGIYIVTTLAYSFVLKRKPLIDVITLGGLYTLRVLGGVAAIGSYQSPWLLMFCLFLFLCLAIVKRCSELVARIAQGKLDIKGRGYRVGDLQVLTSLGAAAGYGSVLVVALYLASPEVVALYGHPTRLWLVTPLLLYWISRVLIISHRGEMHDDPVVFALRDRVSWLVGVGVGVVVVASM